MTGVPAEVFRFSGRRVWQGQRLTVMPTYTWASPQYKTRMPQEAIFVFFSLPSTRELTLEKLCSPGGTELQ